MRKNALDHASRPYGESVWAGKLAGVPGASVGASGTCMAQQHFRNILTSLDVPTLGQSEAFVHTTDGLFATTDNIREPSRQFLQGWMDLYVSWVKKHAAPAALTSGANAGNPVSAPALRAAIDQTLS